MSKTNDKLKSFYYRIGLLDGQNLKRPLIIAMLVDLFKPDLAFIQNGAAFPDELISDNCNIDKNKPGVGITTAELKARRDSILILPATL